ncbi:MAG: DNA polymerase III subunit delta' [Pseudomonadota bacterium]|nr:DNA polymerase III subunit delta' [Pseudomonadota bacterium]
MNEAEDPREVSHHPRRRFLLVGHEAAERKLKDAYTSGRLHSAWLLGGPRGIGKATLAYRFARFLLTRPDDKSLAGPGIEVAPDHPVARRIAAGSHPDLLRIERAFIQKTGRIQPETSAEVARTVPRFFAHTAGEGGWRVCIIDTADDLNEVSANVLLKTLEEPPPQSLIILLSHAPGRLLGTIRSRCVKIGLAPLDKNQVINVLRSIPNVAAPLADIELAAELSRGSPGRALELLESGASRLFAMFRDLLAQLPGIDMRRALALADQLQARRNEDAFDIFCELLTDWVAERARQDALEGGKATARWAAAHGELGLSIAQTNALNLDRRQFVVHAFETLRDAAGHALD